MKLTLILCLASLSLGFIVFPHAKKSEPFSARVARETQGLSQTEKNEVTKDLYEQRRMGY
jgi:hypothetical protein